MTEGAPLLTRSRIGNLALLLLAVYLALTAARLTAHHVRAMHDLDRSAPDYRVFYDAGTLVAEGHRDLLYDKPGADALLGRDVFGRTGPYQNPPVFALAMAPLSRLDFATSYSVWTALGVLAFLATGLGSRLLGLRWRDLALVLLAIAAFDPVHIALVQGQPVGLLTLLLGGSMLAWQRERRLLAALLVVPLVIKTQFVLAPTLFFLRRRLSLRGWLAYGAAGIALGLLPFLLLPSHAFGHFLQGAHELALSQYSWNGFLARVFNHDPPLLVIGAIDAVTLALVAVALLRGDAVVGLSAALAGNLLAYHSLLYDWALLVPCAIALAYRPAPLLSRVTTIGLLLLLQVVFSGWVRSLGPGFTTIALVTPVTFLLLAWLALLPIVELSLSKGTPASMKAPGN